MRYVIHSIALFSKPFLLQALKVSYPDITLIANAP